MDQGFFFGSLSALGNVKLAVGEKKVYKRWTKRKTKGRQKSGKRQRKVDTRQRNVDKRQRKADKRYL